MNPLALRMRPDLVLASHGRDDDHYWIVEDPITLKFFRLRDEECSILRMLDGQVTLDEIKQRFERKFAPLRLSTRQLTAFLYRLHELGLLLGNVPGQGAVLSQRRSSRAWTTRFAAFANPLAIRLPGLDAGRLVNWLYPRIAWMYSWPWVFVWTAIVVAALSLVIAEFATFQARLPDFGEFFNLRTAAWFAVALMGVKVLHELGHALMCRRYGGQCREFGVMLLVFLPTLYCDVSGAWRIESKWQRILVSAAGMLVELVLAAIATLLWWFSEPGLINALCLRVMFLCSVSTLLFNANPLVRCDGYYILSDLINVPNLWQESRGLWKRMSWSWLTGRPLPVDPTVPRRLYPALLLYAAASTIYCWLLVAGILWFCLSVLAPQGLSALGWLLTAVVIAGLAMPPLRSTLNALSAPGERRQIRRGRALLGTLGALAALSVVLFVPLPHRISTPLWLEADEAQAVYVSVPGTLQRAAAPGTKIRAGDVLAELASPEIALQIATLGDEVKAAEMRVKHLRLLLSDDPTIAPLIPAEEKSLEDTRQRLVQWQRDQERLALKAPLAGVVISPPVMAARSQAKLAHLARDAAGRAQSGAYLETGTLVCLVGEERRCEAILAIEQSSVPQVRPGQSVRLRFDQAPGVRIQGKISEVSRDDADQVPGELAHALDLPIKRSGQTDGRTAETYYQARVALAPSDSTLLVGMTGQAKIAADWQSLASRLGRYLNRTFRLR